MPLYPFLQHIGKLNVVLLGEEEMAVALDAYLRQDHELRLATMAIDAIHKLRT